MSIFTRNDVVSIPTVTETCGKAFGEAVCLPHKTRWCNGAKQQGIQKFKGTVGETSRALFLEDDLDPAIIRGQATLYAAIACDDNM